MVICLERGADLHMAQLMPLLLTVSCFSKIQIGFTFLVPAHPGSPEKAPLNGCVCVCVCVGVITTNALHLGLQCIEQTFPGFPVSGQWRRHGVAWGGHVHPTFARGRS